MSKWNLLKLLIPLVMSGIINVLFLLHITSSNIEQQTNDYGSAISSQLAVTLTKDVVRQDILSLNVLLSELVEQQYFEFASVYSADNRLIAQAGERRANAAYLTFTADIAFQDEIAGYVEVGVNPEFNNTNIYQGLLLLLAANLLLIALCIFFWLKPFSFPALAIPGYFRSMLASVSFGFWTSSNPVDQDSQQLEKADKGQTILIIKSNRDRLANNFHLWISQSVSLYGGKIQSSHPGEHTLLFSGSNQTFSALCCAWLLLSMCRNNPKLIEFKAGVHRINPDEFEICRKHASYLASIASNSILVSKEITADISSNEGIEMADYHSSAVSDDEVYTLYSLSPATTELIERQVQQLDS